MDPPIPFSKELDQVANTLRLMDAPSAMPRSEAEYNRILDYNNKYAAAAAAAAAERPQTGRGYTQPNYYAGVQRPPPTNAPLAPWPSAQDDAQQLQHQRQQSYGSSNGGISHDAVYQQQQLDARHGSIDATSTAATSPLTRTASRGITEDNSEVPPPPPPRSHRRRASSSVSNTQSPIAPAMYPPPSKPLPAVPTTSARSSSQTAASQTTPGADPSVVGSPAHVARHSSSTGTSGSAENRHNSYGTGERHNSYSTGERPSGYSTGERHNSHSAIERHNSYGTVERQNSHGPSHNSRGSYGNASNNRASQSSSIYPDSASASSSPHAEARYGHPFENAQLSQSQSHPHSHSQSHSHSRSQSHPHSHSHSHSQSPSQAQGYTRSHTHKSPSTSSTVPPPRPPRPAPRRDRPLVRCTKMLVPEAGKGKTKDVVRYIAPGLDPAVLACKYGNNVVRVWSTGEDRVVGTVKISSYTQAKTRSRDYLVRSHAVLSRTAALVAVTAKFGLTLEIHNWAERKCVQTIAGADRWAVSGVDVAQAPWSQLAVYHGEDHTIDLYSTPGHKKKPLSKVRIIHLQKAHLPLIPQYPELAMSATAPLLVAAAGPRPPRRGHPPPTKETVLVAWDISENSQTSHLPHRMVRPWLHEELETAIPCDLVTHASLVVSLWIPASFRSVVIRTAEGHLDYGLVPHPVPHKVVLVWDMDDNSTRTWSVPNTTACISPDCRFVAYCKGKTADANAAYTLVILDAVHGAELWRWPGPDGDDATSQSSGSTSSATAPGGPLDQLRDLSHVTELAFSADGERLIVGDASGNTGFYDWARTIQ